VDVIASETSDSLVYLELSGRMDTAGVEKAEARFFALFAPRATNTVFDLTKVVILTSMGMRILIAGAKIAAAKNFRAILVAPAGPVRDVLDSTAIGELIPIMEDAAAARSLIRSADPTNRG
jgi:anti-sigma B factor antagonist